MNLNLTADYQVWDDLEPVFWQFDFAPLSPELVQRQPIAQALRRAPTYKEMAASNGAYTGQDLVWELPAVLTPGTPKMGDQILDGQQANTWTILEVSLDAVQSVWRCVTRNLSIAFGLNDVIDIQQSGLSYDADGAVVRAWPDGSPNVGGTVLYSRVSSRVQPQVSEMGVDRGIRGQDTKFSIFLAQQLVLDVRECRVKWQDVYGFVGVAGAIWYLDHVQYRNAQRIDELPTLEAVLEADSVANNSGVPLPAVPTGLQVV